MKKIDGNFRLLNLLIILSLIIFPFGQILKIEVLPNIKISLLDISVLLIILFNFVSLKKLTQKPPLLTKSTLIFIFICLLSLVVNIHKLSGIQILTGLAYLVRFALYFTFYLVIFLNYNSTIKKIINYGLLITGFTFTIFGFLQYWLYPDLRNLLYLGWDPHFYRLFSTFFDPNFAGIILVLTLFQFIFITREAIVRKKQILLLGSVITSVALLLTYSRSALLAFLLGLLVLIINRKKITRDFLVLIGAVIILLLIPKPKVDVFDIFRVTSSVARIMNWRQSLLLSLKMPILGHGFGIYRFSDASFFYVLISCGLIGFLSFFWIWIKIFVFGFLKDYRLAVIATVLFVSSWFNNTLFYSFVMYWFFLFLASIEGEAYGS